MQYGKLWLGLLVTLIIANVAFAGPDAVAGKQKAVACAACHNVDGNSTNPTYPKIAGQNSRYLIEQLLDFKQGAASGRDNPIMQAIVAGLSNQDILDLAAYFNTQTMSRAVAEPKYVKLGQEIYRGGLAAKNIPACSACHDPMGRGNAQAGFPWLAGQNPEYTIAQLQAYKDGTRKNDINGIMRTIAAKMNKQEMTAIASYIAGLH